MQLYLNLLLSIVINNYFNNSMCFIHLYYTNDNPTHFVHVQHVPIVIKNISEENIFTLDKNQKCKHFLIQTKQAKRLFEATENVIKTQSIGMYNSRRYIIIVDNETSLQTFFTTNLLTFVRDVLVIYAPQQKRQQKTNRIYEYIFNNEFTSDDTSTNEYHYQLFTHKYIGLEGNNDPILLDTWYANNLTFKLKNNLFPDKVTDQQGRELRAPCFTSVPFADCGSNPVIGNEHNIVVKYAQRFNYTLISYLNNSHGEYGNLAENWTGEGPIFGLYLEDEDYCDVVYGGFPAHLNVDEVISVIYKYIASVPLPTIKYGLFMFIEVFDWNVWLCILIFYLLSRGLLYLRSKSKKNDGLNTLTIFGLFIYQSTTNNNITKSKYVKYIILLLLFASVLLSTAFNSRLSSVMVKPIYQNDINSLRELAASDLQLLFFDEYYSLLQTDERETYRKLYNKVILIPNSTDFELSERMLSSGKYAVARYRRINGHYYESDEYLEQMKGKYKPIPRELFTDYYYLLLRKNSMHTDQLEKLVESAVEVGLMRYWEEYALLGEIITQKKFQEYSLDTQSILNFQHLKGIFAFWGCGLVISFIVFLKELFRKSRKQIEETRYYKHYNP